MKKIYPFLLLFIYMSSANAQCGFTLSTSTQSPLCYGNSDGSATVTVNGGVGPFTYQWTQNGTTIGTNDTITGLPAGTYSVYVTDQSGPCTDSVSVTVNQPAPLSSNSSVYPNTCYMNNGVICVYATGGTGAYTYSIDGTNFTGNNCFNNLFTANYTVTVMDANGCMYNESVFLYEVYPPIVTVSAVDATCGQCNGSLTAIATGGSSPYTYTWQTGSTTANVTGACAGVYTVTVTDANGCAVTATAVVNNQSANINVFPSVIPAACGQNNGAFIPGPITGDNPPFTAYLNNVPVQQDTVQNLPAGTYTLSVVDSFGCMQAFVYSINNSNFNVQLNAVNPDCGVCNGAISTNIIGGSAPYTYNWSNNTSGSSITNACAGNYSVSVTDSSGCFAYASLSLVPPASPQIQLDSLIPASCSSLGSLQVSATGGAGTLSYTWNPAVSSTNVASNLPNGIYTVTVTDTSGCSSSQSFNVPNNSTLYIYLANSVPSNCGSGGALTVGVFNGVPPYQYLWDNGDTTQTSTNLSAGMHSVTVTDAVGCQSTGYLNLYTSCMNVVRGRVYNDQNQNCVQDALELGIQGRIIYDNGAYAYTDSLGDYTLYTGNMTPAVTNSNNYYGLPYSYVCPSTPTLSLSFSQVGDTINNADFAMYLDPNYHDLSIHPGWMPGHPGFAKDYWILFANNSAAPQNAVITFIYDSVLIFNSCNSGGVHYPAQHKIVWTYNNVATSKGWDWGTDPRAYFTVPVTVSITANLQSYFEITPIAGDITPSDNVLNIVEPVTGSRDPNEKSVIPKGDGPDGNILVSDSVLFYTVHFQNNGNDTAFTVVVVDTLSNNLDPATIIPGASNHAYTFNLSGPGVMTWRFDHIMLPDSLTNEPESNGYFNYTVKVKPGIPLGSQIKNTAYIYFDFNDAVITNTTVNTLVAPVGLSSTKSNDRQLLLYPNPATHEVMLQFELKEASETVIEIYSLVGSLIKTQDIKNAQKGLNLTRLELTDLNSGVYLVKLKSASNSSFQRLVIQK